MAILKNTTVSDTGNLRLPVGTTAQRPSPQAGQFRYNTTTGGVEIYTAGANIWQPAAARGVRAAGGTVYDVDVDGTTYRVHVFTTTGNSTFTVSRAGPVEYLIVAGGGEGVADRGGAGGAGGLLAGTTTVTPQAYTITVGAGGAAKNDRSLGNNGGNSVAFGLTAIGGGGGGTGGGANGRTGGSGGGAGNGPGQDAVTTGGLGTAGQGNNGGSSVYVAPNYGSGGGGGAGSAGRPGTSAVGGDGGNGLLSFITGLFTFYAGGGGGGSYGGPSYPSGIGGLGGGGNGSPTSATPGGPNTGGGAGNNGQGTTGVAGGSGIVVMRYPLQSEPDVAAPKVTGDGLVLDLDFAKPTAYIGSGTAVTDSRLNGISGTLVGSPIFTGVRTHRTIMTFDGVDDHITLSSGFADFTSGITVIAYANFGVANVWERIIDFANGQANNNILLARSSTTNTLRFEIYVNTAASLIISATEGVLNNTMACYAATANGSTAALYRNGAVLSTLSSTVLPVNITRTINYIGRSNWAADAYFQSEMGMVKIYNRALTATEISQDFEATRWRFGV
jgi:hypothetical protein